MPTIQEFLSINPGFPSLDFGQPRASNSITQSTVTLLGIALAATDDEIVFAHLGHRFYVQISDIASIEETSEAIPNPFAAGKPVSITMAAGARLLPFGAVTAHMLTSGVPFAISRPSQVPDIDYPFHTANELAWLANNNIAAGDPQPTSTSSGTYCGHNTQSPKWSGTNSNGKQDDGKSDEYYGDDASHDDTGADD